MRAFTAFNLPVEMRESLSEVIDNLRSVCGNSVKWVEDENLHITLLFLGDIPPSAVKDIDYYMNDLLTGFGSFEVKNPVIEVMPGKNPRIIWVRFETGREEVKALPRRLRNRLDFLDIENKKFKMHVTLGRVKKTLNNQMVQHILTSEIKPDKCQIEEAALYKSILRPQGPVYEIIKQYEL